MMAKRPKQWSHRKKPTMKTDAKRKAEAESLDLQIAILDRIIDQEEVRKLLAAKKRKPILRWPWSK
jgi:hypothetical protein